MTKHAQHTPGPWEITISSDNESYRIHHADEEAMFKIAVVDGFAPVMDINNDMEAEGLANAQLIAAAPDLLSALETLKGWFEYAKEHGYENAYELNPAYFEQAEKAIAKARGE